MYDEKIYDWIDDLTKFEPFKECISGLSEKWIKEQYDKELVWRLIVFQMFEFKSKIMVFFRNF